MQIEREHVARPPMLARLPDAGAPGTTQYTTPGDRPPVNHPAIDAEAASELCALAAASETGSVLFVRTADVTLVLPPFPVERALDVDALEPGPLVELLERRRTVGVFLLRLGGYTAGVLRGETVADSKTDQRFVKNRHRKGGQSQRRFERIREKQVHELFKAACEDARATLAPYADEIERVFLGGDRRTLLAFGKECAFFERFGRRLAHRVLPVAGDPRRATLDVIGREIWSSDVYTVRLPPGGLR